MGLAVLVLGVGILLALLATIFYGIYQGVVRGGTLVWRFLLDQSEERDGLSPGNGVMSNPCWEAKNCPPATRKACPVFESRDEETPCWMTALRNNGRLRLGCQSCNRFDLADVVA